MDVTGIHHSSSITTTKRNHHHYLKGDYSLANDRMKSFELPFYKRYFNIGKGGIKKLARMGFFAVKDGFSIRCYYCYAKYNLKEDHLSIVKYLLSEKDDEQQQQHLSLFHNRLNPNCSLAVDNLLSRSKPIKSFLSFYYERERLDSFIDWPVQWLKARHLAAKGFYYSRYSNRIICAFCDSIFYCNWGKRLKRHKCCPSSRVMNIPITISNVLAKFLTEKKYPLPQFESGEVSKNYEFFIKNGLHPVRPNCEDMNDYRLRLKTFRRWPRNRITQTPEELANAGFFYSGTGDVVYCFHCEGGLKNWELGDGPLKLHAKYYPTCSFIICHYYYNNHNIIIPSPPVLITNPLYWIAIVKVVKTNAGGGRDDDDDDDEMKIEFAMRNVKNDHHKRLTITNTAVSAIANAKRENKRNGKEMKDDDDDLCKICLSNKPQVVFGNCRHECTCFECFKKLYKNNDYSRVRCPYCRADITSFLIPYHV